jgi:protease-4
MKKFLLGLVAGFVLAGFAGFVFVFAIVRASDRKPSVPENATLVVKMSGEVPEIAPMEIPLPMIESHAPLTMRDMWDLFRKAEVDPRIKAVVLEPAGLAVGWGKVQELRDSIVKFRKSGKPVYAFLRAPRTKDYYLATAASEVYLAKEDVMDVKGISASLSFYRRALQKIGVRVEIEHAGRFKDFGTNYTRDTMTMETRESVNALLDGIFGHLTDTIAASRKKTADEIRATIDQGPFLASDAMKFGLVDGLRFEDEVFDEVKKRLKQDSVQRISHRDYHRVPAGSAGLTTGAKIALVAGQGGIYRGGDGDGFTEESDLIAAGPFTRLLRQVGEDPSIKGVILRLDSPGGDAIASEEILHEARKLSSKKPTVISMSDVAASGGYYIAMTGDPVVSYPYTVTGSIGVVFGKIDIKGLYDKLGIRNETLKRGRNADIDSPYKPLDAAARLKLRQGVEETYRTFLDRVAEGRKKKREEIEPYAEGRVWLGTHAKQHGLVDELGGLDKAIDLLRPRMKIDAKEKVELVLYPKRKSIFEQLFGEADQAIARTVRQRIRGALKQAGLGHFDPAVWAKGGFLAISPYGLEID